MATTPDPAASGHLDAGHFHDWDAPAYVIAEAGVNHGANLSVALEMIRVAARSGVDAIKFQTYSAERIATRSSEAYWDRSKEPSTSQYALFKKYDAFGEAEYQALAEECGRAGVTFLTTPFDIESVEWLDGLLPAWKIASADITNFPLLGRVAATGKPVLLSTGASTMDEVKEAVTFLREHGASDVCLLHCTLSYPTPTEDAALGAIVDLGRTFPECGLGYSDHTLPHDSFAAAGAAFALGARVIEKHFTLDKTKRGNDHWHAFDGADFARLVDELARLRSMLGEPVKRVLPAEKAARTHARRSLVSRGNIARGEVITADSLDVKRPGTGIEPRNLERIIGWRATRDIADDVTLEWDMIEAPSTG